MKRIAFAAVLMLAAVASGEATTQPSTAPIAHPQSLTDVVVNLTAEIKQLKAENEKLKAELAEAKSGASTQQSIKTEAIANEKSGSIVKVGMTLEHAIALCQATAPMRHMSPKIVTDGEGYQIYDLTAYEHPPEDAVEVVGGYARKSRTMMLVTYNVAIQNGAITRVTRTLEH